MSSKYTHLTQNGGLKVPQLLITPDDDICGSNESINLTKEVISGSLSEKKRKQLMQENLGLNSVHGMTPLRSFNEYKLQSAQKSVTKRRNLLSMPFSTITA